MKAFPSLVATLLGLFLTQPGHGQDSSLGRGDPSYAAGEYRVFTGAGDPVTLEEIVTAMGRNEVVFIGETHDDPTGHWLEAELLRRAHETFGVSNGDGTVARAVTVSLEFFQRDVQPILNEYLAGLITEKAFTTDSRPWPRYETDYRPVVEYAKAQGLPVIAANPPRRYTNRATRLGRESLEELSDKARATIAPLPYGMPSRAYVDQWIQVMSDVMEEQRMKCGVPIVDSITTREGDTHQPPGAHGNAGNQLDGQVLWDATMAHSISDHLIRHPDALVLHMVGSFHVARGTGIPEHLVRYRPGSSGMIVMLRPVDDVETFESAPDGQWGDFVVQTDRSRTLQALECLAPLPR